MFATNVKPLVFSRPGIESAEPTPSVGWHASAADLSLDGVAQLPPFEDAERGPLLFDSPGGSCCGSCAAGGECEGGCAGSCSRAAAGYSLAGSASISGTEEGGAYLGMRGGGECCLGGDPPCLCKDGKTPQRSSPPCCPSDPPPIKPIGCPCLAEARALIDCYAKVESDSVKNKWSRDRCRLEARKCDLGPRQVYIDCASTKDKYRQCPPIAPAVCKEQGEKKICGPELTDWLVNQLNKNAKWLEDNLPWYVVLFTGMQTFNDKVKEHAPWDFKNSTFPKWTKGRLPKGVKGTDANGNTCPTKCPETITLCGMCFRDDVPANIHYMYVGRRIFQERTLYAGSYVAEFGKAAYLAKHFTGKPEPRWDLDAMSVGAALHNARKKTKNDWLFDNFLLKKKLCKLVKKLSIHREKECNPCV